LLVKVYLEYKYFDKSKLNKPADHGNNLTVKKEESITGPKQLFEQQDFIQSQSNEE
jgi:hypothetical protein